MTSTRNCTVAEAIVLGADGGEAKIDSPCTLNDVEYFVTTVQPDKAHIDAITEKLRSGSMRYIYESTQNRKHSNVTDRTYDISISDPVLLKSYICFNWNKSDVVEIANFI